MADIELTPKVFNSLFFLARSFSFSFSAFFLSFSFFFFSFSFSTGLTGDGAGVIERGLYHRKEFTVEII